MHSLTNVLKKCTSTLNNRAARLYSRENFRGHFGFPKHFSWGARASKLVAQINKSVSLVKIKQIIFLTRQVEFCEYFIHEKSHSFDLLSVRKKNTRMLSYESKFSRHMRNMGNAARIFHVFLNGKVRFWSVYVFFIKKFGVKNKGTILSTNQFDLR